METCIVISCIIVRTLAYVDLLAWTETLPPTHKYEPYQFKSFDRMQEQRFAEFKFGFPAGIYGSSVIPITLWFMHWDHVEPFLMVPNFSTMILIPIDWFFIVRACDEIKLPRCSWAHFINLAQPLQIYRELLDKRGLAEGISTEKVIIPYLHGDCWPIRSVEQASVIYTYAVCIVYWDVPGFDRHICPQPCAQKPCSLLAFARAGSCHAFGIHLKDYECECSDGFSWDRLTFTCIHESRCEKICHPSNTATCKRDLKTGLIVCLCRLGYMGYDCSAELDACLVGSDIYNTVEDMTAGPIIPPGREACGMENDCIPQMGTTSFSCRCGQRYAMDLGLPYDNCFSKRNPCSSRICIDGTCISAEDGSWSMCDCEDGFTGEMCEEAVGMWSTWSEWSSCEPFCGDRRYRQRVRICLGAREEDCIGAVEHVESCQSGDPCPHVVSPDEEEWQDFASWVCFVLGASVIYICLLLLALTILALCKPISQQEGHQEPLFPARLSIRNAGGRMTLRQAEIFGQLQHRRRGESGQLNGPAQ